MVISLGSFGRKKHKTMNVARKYGNFIYDEEKVGNRCKNCMKETINKTWFLKREDEVEQEETGEPIIERELKKAMQKLKSSKM